MTNTNRADRIEQLYKVLKKHYKPTNIAVDRPVLDLLLYACCLEDAKFESADEAFACLQQTYFDWNEVRVTTVAELSEILGSLPNPAAAAARIKRSLQALFEQRYSFDLDDLRKANLGKTISEMENWPGITRFVVGFLTQNGLGGHAIPVDQSTMDIFKLFEIVSPAEADKGQVPGLERAIAKAKGPEFATLLHQFAVDFKTDAKSATALAVFKELGVNPKPKAPPPPPPKAVKKAAEPIPPTATKIDVKSSKPGAKSKPAAEPTKAEAPKGSEPKKVDTKKGDTQKMVAKSSAPEPKKIAPTKSAAESKKPNTGKKSAPPEPASKSNKLIAKSTKKESAPTIKSGHDKTKDDKSKDDKPKDHSSKKMSPDPKKGTPPKKPMASAKKPPAKPVGKGSEKHKLDTKKITKKKPK